MISYYFILLFTKFSIFYFSAASCSCIYFLIFYSSLNAFSFIASGPVYIFLFPTYPISFLFLMTRANASFECRSILVSIIRFIRNIILHYYQYQITNFIHNQKQIPFVNQFTLFLNFKFSNFQYFPFFPMFSILPIAHFSIKLSTQLLPITHPTTHCYRHSHSVLILQLISLRLQCQSLYELQVFPIYKHSYSHFKFFKFLCLLKRSSTKIVGYLSAGTCFDQFQ